MATENNEVTKTTKKAAPKKATTASKTTAKKKTTSSKSTTKKPVATSTKKPVKKVTKPVVKKNDIDVEEKVIVENKPETNDLASKLFDQVKNISVQKPTGVIDEKDLDHVAILKKKMEAQKKLKEQLLDDTQPGLPKIPVIESIEPENLVDDTLVEENKNLSDELERLKMENDNLKNEVNNLVEDVNVKDERIIVLTNTIVGKASEVELTKEIEELKKQNELLKEELEKKKVIEPVEVNKNTESTLIQEPEEKDNLSENSTYELKDKGEIILRIKLLNERIAEKDKQINLVEEELNKLSEKDIVAESFTTKIKEIRKMRKEDVGHANSELEELAKLVKLNEEKLEAKKNFYDDKCKEIVKFEKELASLQLTYTEKENKLKVRSKLNAEKDVLFIEIENTEENYKKLVQRYKKTLKAAEDRIEKLNAAENDIINLYLTKLKEVKSSENKDYIIQKEERETLLNELDILTKKIQVGYVPDEENISLDTYDINKVRADHSKVLGKLNMISTKLSERERIEKVILKNEESVKNYYEAFRSREIALFNINENKNKIDLLQKEYQSTGDQTLVTKIDSLKILIDDDKEKADYFNRIINENRSDEKVIFYNELINSMSELVEASKDLKKKEEVLRNKIELLED